MFGVELDPPAFQHHARVLHAPELVLVQTLVGTRLLNDSAKRFCQGLPGSMWCVVAPWVSSHSVSSNAMNSGPLSDLIVVGLPREAKSLANTPLIDEDVSDLACTTASASLVNSSITVSTFTRRP